MSWFQARGYTFNFKKKAANAIELSCAINAGHARSSDGEIIVQQLNAFGSILANLRLLGSHGFEMVDRVNFSKIASAANPDIVGIFIVVEFMGPVNKTEIASLVNFFSEHVGKVNNSAHDKGTMSLLPAKLKSVFGGNISDA